MRVTIGPNMPSRKPFRDFVKLIAVLPLNMCAVITAMVLDRAGPIPFGTTESFGLPLGTCSLLTLPCGLDVH